MNLQTTITMTGLVGRTRVDRNQAKRERSGSDAKWSRQKKRPRRPERGSDKGWKERKSRRKSVSRRGRKSLRMRKETGGKLSNTIKKEQLGGG